MARIFNIGADPTKPVVKGDTTNAFVLTFDVNAAPVTIVSARMQIKKKAKDTAIVATPTLTVGTSTVTINAQKYDFAAGEFMTLN
jgi:hypothetical protein